MFDNFNNGFPSGFLDYVPPGGITPDMYGTNVISQEEMRRRQSYDEKLSDPKMQAFFEQTYGRAVPLSSGGLVTGLDPKSIPNYASPSAPAVGNSGGLMSGLDPNAIAADPAGFQQWMQGAQNYYSNAAPAPVSAPATGGTSYSFNPTNIAGTGSYDTEDWMSTIGGLFTGGLTGAASAAGINEQVARLRALGGAAATDYGNLAQQAIQGVEFTPYTITTPGLGTVEQTAPGVISQTLTPQQQANIDAAARMQGELYGTALPDTSGIQQQAFGNTGRFLTPQDNQQLTNLSSSFGDVAQQQVSNLAGASTQDMAKQLYEQQLGLLSPSQERQQLELENRLRAQGRLGLSTAAYGGAPEQLALAKAQEEQRQKAAYDALTGAEGMLTSQQSRAQSAAQASSAMAAANQALQQGDVQTAASLFNIGQSAAQLPSTLRGQALTQAGQAQQQALTPAQQQMQQLQQASSLGQQRASTNYQAGSMFGNLVGTGLQERLTAESAAAALRGKQYASALDALARQSGTTGSTAAAQAIGNVTGVIDLIKSGYDAISDMFSGVDFSSDTWATDTGIELSQSDLDFLNEWVQDK